MAIDERGAVSHEVATIRAELQTLGVTQGLGYLTDLRLQSLHPEQIKPVSIGDNYIPMALTTENERQASGITRVSFTQDLLTNPAYSDTTQPLSLVITDMDAGTGTSIARAD